MLLLTGNSSAFAQTPSYVSRSSLNAFKVELADRFNKKFEREVIEFPPPIVSALRQARQECNSMQDGVGAIGAFVYVRDLNGDRLPDVVVDYRGACATKRMVFCDVDDQCKFQIWLSDGPLYKLALEARPSLAFFSSTVTESFVLNYPLSRCGLNFNSKQLCQTRYRVEGANIVPEK